MNRIFGLVGVPSSAGAHYPGQEKAPATLRRAGLDTQLTGMGISIVDYGDLASVCCRVDPNTSQADRIAEVRTVAAKVANSVEKIMTDQKTPLVIGGDCTSTIGVLPVLFGSNPISPCSTWMADLMQPLWLITGLVD